MILAIPFIGTITVGFALKQITDTINSFLEFVNNLPKLLAILVYVLLIYLVIGSLSATLALFNNISPVDVPTCVTKNSFSWVAPLGYANNGSGYCADFGYNSITPECVLMKLHPSCVECVASGFDNDLLCKTNYTTSLSTKTSFYYKYRNTLSMPYGPAPSSLNTTKDSCVYAITQGDAFFTYLWYTNCLNGPKIDIIGQSNQCFGTLDIGIKDRVAEISSQGVEYKNGQTVVTPQEVEGDIFTTIGSMLSFTPQPCNGIYLLDAQKWVILYLLVQLVAFSLVYYNSIWQFIIKR